MTTTKEKKGGSRVRVGVRVRPLTSHEIREGGNYGLNLDSPTIRMGRRTFTYDAVFDANYGQAELYESVSTRLLSSFVDGYNATVSIYSIMEISFVALSLILVSFCNYSLLSCKDHGIRANWFWKNFHDGE